MKESLFLNSNPEKPGFLKFIAAGKVWFIYSLVVDLTFRR